MGTEETLASEARLRPRLALAATGASLIPVVATVAAPLAFGTVPGAPVLVALERAAAPGPVSAQPSVRLASAEFTVDRAAIFIGFGLLLALGALLTGYVLWALGRFARARRPDLPRLALQLPIVGSVLLALTYVLGRVAQVTSAQALVDGPRTVEAAGGGGGLGAVTGVLAVPAILAFGASFVFVALFAMRVGLLTRFLGILGIFIGVAFGFTFGGITPIPQAIWLAALAFLFLGRWPDGVPPAWRTGQAEPWPSQQELREARERAAAAPSDPAPDPEPRTATAASAAPRSGHPVSRKKKRKRRAP